MSGMEELARTRTELKTALLKGVKGSHADERAQNLIDYHQMALKKALTHRLAEEIREAGSHLGHNTNLAYRRAADLIDPKARP